jgi:hypothetical protein
VLTVRVRGCYRAGAGSLPGACRVVTVRMLGPYRAGTQGGPAGAGAAPAGITANASAGPGAENPARNHYVALQQKSCAPVGRRERRTFRGA